MVGADGKDQRWKGILIMTLQDRIRFYTIHREAKDHDENCIDRGGCQFIEELLKKLTEYKDWTRQIAHDERVTGWVHGEDYSLYCLLADCPVDYDDQEFEFLEKVVQHGLQFDKGEKA